MVNAQLALFGAPKRARALALSAAGAPAGGQPDLPELSAPSIAVGPLSGRPHAAEPPMFDGVAIPIPDAAPSWAHDKGSDRAADPPGDFSAVRPGAGQSQKPSAGSGPKFVQRLSAALLTGALLMTFGLGWIGGSTSNRLFGPHPAVPAVKQKSSLGRPDTRASAEAGRESAAPSTRKLAHAPAARPEYEPVPVPNGMRNLPRLLPVPETRPTTIEGWTVREVSGRTATLEGPDGIWRAARGDIVPGLGRVDSIVRWGSFWLVSTSRGLVASE